MKCICLIRERRKETREGKIGGIRQNEKDEQKHERKT